MSEARYDPVADFYATAFDSAALIGKALEAERANPLGMRYVDDLDGALAGADALLRPGGRFVHPCFPGAPGVSASWPPSARYYDEGRWTSDAELSALRRQVGAQHRMLSSYLNAFRRHGLWLDELREPVPASQWADSRPGADRVPVYVAGRCLKMRLPADEPVSSPRCAAEAAG